MQGYENTYTSAKIQKYNETKKMFQEVLKISDEEFDNFYEEYQKEFLDNANFRKIFTNQGLNPDNITRGILLEYSPEDLLIGNNLMSSFAVTDNYGFNRINNSISLVNGTKVDLGNGIVLHVEESSVSLNYKEGYNIKESDIEMASEMAGALNIFIRYANCQAGTLYFGEKEQRYIINILKTIGININKDFSVNGSIFNIENGKIIKQGSYAGYTHISQQMLEKVMRQTISKYEKHFAYVD